MDWTDSFKQTEINEFSNSVLEILLDRLVNLNINEFREPNISKKEIGLLYRWVFYLSISTFTERFLRTICNKDLEQKFESHSIKVSCVPYSNILETTLNFYNNNKLNNHLLINLDLLIHNHKDDLKIEEDTKIFSTNTLSFKEKIANAKNFFKFFLKLSYYKFFFKSSEIHENNNQLNLIFPKKNSFINYYYNENYKLSNDSRNKIQNLAKEIFIEKYSFFLNNQSNQQIEKISKLFSNWINISLPLSLLEGLKKRFKFYDSLLKCLKIRQFHASTGFFTNENIQIFSILSRRKKILIIGHEHGVNNFITLGKNNYMSHYKGINHFLFPNFFLSWGKNTISDKWINAKKLNVKVMEYGSVYLKSINKSIINHDIKFDNNSKKQNTIFYCASQFRKYMTNLEELSPEKNFLHKKKVAEFLKILIEKNKNIKIIYKPFPENIDNEMDPFKKIFLNEIKNNIVIVSKESSIKLMHLADIVLFDLISTGFAEAININKISIVFSNKFEFERSSIEGKKINKRLYDNGVFFDNYTNGLQIIKKIIHNENNFRKKTALSISEFRNKLCCPITKKEFLIKYNNFLINLKVTSKL